MHTVHSLKALILPPCNSSENELHNSQLKKQTARGEGKQHFTPLYLQFMVIDDDRLFSSRMECSSISTENDKTVTMNTVVGAHTVCNEQENSSE